MPDVTVMDKQVVVIEHDNWVQVEDVIKEKNLVTLGLGGEGLQDGDMGIGCDYTGEVSIDDDAFGIVLSNKGQFVHQFQITRRIIRTHIEINITRARTFQTLCNISNMATPTFRNNSNQLALNQMLIAMTGNLSSFCCLSTTNILSSFGSDCPHSSMDLSQLSKQCAFSTFFEGRCNQVTSQRLTSRFCKSENSSCILQEYFQTPCDFPQQLLNVCNLLNKIC